MNNEIINYSVMLETKSIMKDRFPQMIGYYFEDTENYMKNLQEAINNNEIDKVVSQSHTIKSSSYQLGVQKVSDIAGEMEVLALNNTASDELFAKLKDLNLHLNNAYQESVPELKKLAN